LENIHAVLTAPDPGARNTLISAHLARLEADLARTQNAVASLRGLLDRPETVAPIEHRHVEATQTAAISQVIDIADAPLWYQGALGELRATLAGQGAPVTRPAGGIYSSELFAEERGQATVFITVDAPVRPVGRVEPLTVPAAELATIVHTGPHAVDLDRAYGTLATYVTDHALGVDGPIREYYLVGPSDTSEETEWKTEIGWPIVQMSGPTDDHHVVWAVPPSITYSTPLTQELRSETRKVTSSAMSSGVPGRPIGIPPSALIVSARASPRVIPRA
jgi:effector-binding domain-containing protein